MLKNTYTCKNQFKGIACEKAVIRLLVKNGWQFEFQRVHTEISEIDLIFTKNKKLILVEVKKLDQDWQAFERISQKQIISLQKNLNLFTSRFHELDVAAYIAWVNRVNQITFVVIG